MKITEQFDTRVERIPFSGCWIWTGHATPGGYGVISHDGKQQYAHRVSFEFHIGKKPGELNVCHRCDVPSCVNPDHLFLGTQSDNVKDAYDKGRKIAVKGPSKKTHCPQGHPYDLFNTQIRANGHRRCAECHRAQERERNK